MTVGFMSKRKSLRLNALWYIAFKTIEFTMHLFDLFTAARFSDNQLRHNSSVNSSGLLCLHVFYYVICFLLHSASYSPCRPGYFFVTLADMCLFPDCRSPPLVS